MSWKEQLAKAYTTVPHSWREFAWKICVAGMAITSTLTGFYLWKHPQILIGIPSERQSPVERLAGNEDIREDVYTMMEGFFYANRPYGLMLVSWEEIESMVGLWVRPADKFPGKSGVHDLTPDMRILGGPFLFGECSHTESLAMPGRIMVACPIVNSYDVWGYVAAVVEDDPATVSRTKDLLRFLSHRVTALIY